jgi:glycosyltransferase involved in cell wall biosynthesis
MNILQIANKVPYPPKDGGSIATFNHTRGFALLGHHVTILSLNTKKHHVDIESLNKELTITKIIAVDINTSISSLKALRNYFFSKLPYNAERFISEPFRIKLIEILQTKQFDVIQLEGLYLMPYIESIRQYSKALVVFRAHNVEHEIWERTSMLVSNPFRRMYLKNLAARIKQFEISCLNKYDVIVPITERDAVRFEQLGNTKPIYVSPSGIDVDKEMPKAELEFPSLFHLGALDWAPNQEGLIWFIKNCWSVVSLKYPDLKFYIAGRNAPKWFIRKMNKRNIIFCGEVEKAKEFIQSKAIMVVPLFSGGGMRVKIIEGMANRKPIISTSIGAEGIFYYPNKNIIIADNKESFIKAIDKLVNSKSLCIEIGAKAYQLVSKDFDNLAISTKLINFYKEHGAGLREERENFRKRT